ncbi:hypothetical protein [Sphingobium nicotianae]|uniref:TonB C-terminal domain-containing protein n=1 Tax=Sphingobium nicotianae TaxID=2782607 RepID=A0A9X1DB77_9SPHN|nr:hypothetical protein [Sphingobium nicotianae]MBT2186742.1 hypothetical protein [Sphingobium nicotianae]
MIFAVALLLSMISPNDQATPFRVADGRFNGHPDFGFTVQRAKQMISSLGGRWQMVLIGGQRREDVVTEGRVNDPPPSRKARIFHDRLGKVWKITLELELEGSNCADNVKVAQVASKFVTLISPGTDPRGLAAAVRNDRTAWQYTKNAYFLVLRRCTIIEASARNGEPSPVGVSQVPPAPAISRWRTVEPIGAPWIVREDIPDDMVANKPTTYVSFALQVGSNGQANQCKITNGPYDRPQLNTLICALLIERARFRPALDARGMPTAAVYRRRIVIPGDENLTN